MSLLRCYLNDRSQYVSYGGFESERGKVECGVPQGSVLGPLFFILYVNDMARVSKDIELVLFADDTSIFVKGRNSEELFRRVNQGLKELSVWFRCNKLTLNLKKTEYVYFGGRGGRIVPQGGIKIGGEEINRVGGIRFLGVWVDEGLRWTEQIEKVRTKVSRLLGVLGRVAAVLGGRLVQTLYNALVLPHLQYCLMIWGDFEVGRNKAAGDFLLKLQKRFVGLMSGRSGRYHADPIFSELGILKIHDLYRLQLRVHAWQFYKGRLPDNQAGMLSKVSEVHRHNTRLAGTGLFIATQDQRSIGSRIPREWHSVNEKGKNSNSLWGLKKKSKQEFLASYGSFCCEKADCYVCT